MDSRFFIFKYELHLKNSHHLILSLCNCVCFLRFVNCGLSNCLATRQSTCLKAEARIPVALGCFDGFICYTFGLPCRRHLLILIFHHQVYLLDHCLELLKTCSTSYIYFENEPVINPTWKASVDYLYYIWSDQFIWM